MKQILLAVTAMSVFAASALAQSACPAFVPNVTRNCTTVVCQFDACWPTPQDLTSCAMIITTPTGVLPSISGTINAMKDHCVFTAPKLITGAHSINAYGSNSFGVGAMMPVPLSLTTGQPPIAPSAVAVQ